MTEDSGTQPALVAVLCVGERAENWIATVKTLVDNGVRVVALTAPGVGFDLPEPYAADVVHDTLNSAVEQGVRAGYDAVLVVTSPVVFPPDAFGPSLRLVADDIRTATVSFLSNRAAFLSFPKRNMPMALPPHGWDEARITTALRELPSDGADVPLCVPAGGAVLLAATTLRAVGGLDASAPNPDLAVAHFALLAARRGFVNLLDPTTFVTRPVYPGEGPMFAGMPIDAVDDRPQRDWLAARHYPVFPGLYDDEHFSPTSPVAHVLASRRAGLFGLSVAFDASALRGVEMGTQTTILGQLEALAGDRRISRLIVGTYKGRVPGYAERVLSHPHIEVVDATNGTFDGVDDVDIVHRPLQPWGPLPIARWRQMARRCFVTIHDLIAYENGFYFDSPREFLKYRHDMADAVGQVDGVIAISQTAAQMIRRARLPLAAESLYVIENGTDHLRPGLEPASPPEEVLAVGFAAKRFIVVLGTSYAHKNRDLAIRAWQELRRRGSDLELILAGAVVPTGSSRNEEALAMMSGEAPLVLADVTSGERDWLLSHASVVLYPTSAEGFGLIPFEAAVFDTPSVSVGFGPLEELLPDLPVVAEGWHAEAMADAIEALGSDPALARRQVAAVKAASAPLTWANYADRLISAYVDSLSRPALRPVRPNQK